MDPMLIAQAVQMGEQKIAGDMQMIQGFFQQQKANKIMRSNPRPVYHMPGEVQTNQDIAESRAGQGMSDASRTGYQQENERLLSGGIDAVLKDGGSVNNIGSLYGNSISGTQRMAMLDDEMRSRNIQNLIAQNQNLADYKDKEWQVNVFAPYADKAQAAAALKKQGSDNFWKGLNTVVSGTANASTGSQYQNETQNMFGPHQGAASPDGGNAGNGAYNWQNFEGPGPTRPGYAPPQQVQPVSPYGELSSKYPGLMYGSSFFGG